MATIAFNGALRVACGGPARLLEPDPGWRHDTETQSDGPIHADDEWSGTATVSGLDAPAPEKVYRQGWKTDSSGAVSFTVTGLQPTFDYTVRLHYAVPTGTPSATYQFTLACSGDTTESWTPRDPVAERGAGYGCYVEADLAPDGDGEFAITCTKSSGKKGVLCGFEVLPIAMTAESVPAHPTPSASSAITPPPKPTPSASSEIPPA